MTALREEAMNLVEELPEESLSKLVPFLKAWFKVHSPNHVEENADDSKDNIDDINHGRNFISFTDEEWENFTNAQNLL